MLTLTWLGWQSADARLFLLRQVLVMLMLLQSASSFILEVYSQHCTVVYVRAHVSVYL